MTRPHPTPAGPSVAPGTAEAAWRPVAAGQPWPGWPLDLAGRTRLVVCAAHPDDEVLGVGGLLALLAAAGAQLHLLAATDGEASHPGVARS